MQAKKINTQTKITLLIGISFFFAASLSTPILFADPPDQTTSPTGVLQPEKPIPQPPAEVLSLPEAAEVKKVISDIVSNIKSQPTDDRPNPIIDPSPDDFVDKVGPISRPKPTQPEKNSEPKTQDSEPADQKGKQQDWMKPALSNIARSRETRETKEAEEKRLETTVGEEESKRDEKSEDQLLPDFKPKKQAVDLDATENIMGKTIENTDQNPEEEVVVDAVEYTPEIRATHLLLNPPRRFHPFLKWLLYTGRLTPTMLELYYGALEKSDRMYKSAAQSHGALRIRYQGKFLDPPVYLWPDQADGRYELVAMERRERNQPRVIPAAPQGVNPP